MQVFSESGLFLIGELRAIREIVGRDGKRYGFWTMEIDQDRQNWDVKADFSETNFDGEATELGMLLRAGALEKAVGKRVAVRVIATPSRKQPPGWPDDKSAKGWVNFRAVSLLVIGESSLTVVEAPQGVGSENGHAERVGA